MKLGATEMPPSGRSTHDSKPTTMAWVLDDKPLTEGNLTFFVPRASVIVCRNLKTPPQKNIFKCIK